MKKSKKPSLYKPHLIQFDTGHFGVARRTIFGMQFLSMSAALHWWSGELNVYAFCRTLRKNMAETYLETYLNPTKANDFRKHVVL